MKNFKERYDEVKKQLEITDFDVASIIGKTEGSLRTYLTRNGILPPKLIDPFCNKYGVNKDWLMTGKGEFTLVKENR